MTRRLAARVHLWGGLLLGPLIVVLGLSGAALVFRTELEDTLHRPAAVRTAGPVRSLDAIVAAARLAHPGVEPRALHVPLRADRAYRVEMGVGARRVDVAVDPYTLAVLHSRAPERSPLAAVHALHVGFHAGRAGAIAVGLVGLALVLESGTGLWLYGARWRRAGRRPPRARGWHRAVGAASLVLALVIGATGVALVAIGGAGVMTPRVEAGRLSRLDALAEAAVAAVPGARVRALVAAPDGSVRVALDHGVLRLDPVTARVVAGPGAAPTDAWDVVRRLHAGDFVGWPSRVAFSD